MADLQKLLWYSRVRAVWSLADSALARLPVFSGASSRFRAVVSPGRSRSAKRRPNKATSVTREVSLQKTGATNSKRCFAIICFWFNFEDWTKCRSVNKCKLVDWLECLKQLPSVRYSPLFWILKTTSSNTPSTGRYTLFSTVVIKLRGAVPILPPSVG